MARCLIVGASGQLGRALCRVFQQGHEVVETVRRAPCPGQWQLDLAEPKMALRVIQKTQPDWILIAGAFCNVDRCEEERDACFQANVEGPRAIAQYARQGGMGVAYYSTDHVFDGSREGFQESDPVQPLNVYAQSKAEGETAVRKCLPGMHLILRTAWLYGGDPIRRNFVLRLVDQLRIGQKVLVPSDQWGSPTATEDLAWATRFLIEGGFTGTYHATGPDWVERAWLALRVCDVFGLDSRGVVPASTRELNQRAKRPLRVRLNCEKLQSTGCREFRGIEAGLRWLHQTETGMERTG